MNQINIFVKNKTAIPGQKRIETSSPFDNRSGFYGVVTEVSAKTNTVSVRSDLGRIFTGLRVASLQWVTASDEKGFLSGERNLPLVDSLVYCVMPSGEPTSAFVLCSFFAIDEPNYAELKEDSEDAVFTRKKIDNSGWTFIHDSRTGTRTIQNAPKDETVSIEVNQEEKGKNKITATLYGNTIEIFEENKDVQIHIGGNATLECDGDIEIKAKTGLLNIGNAIATLGELFAKVLDALISFKSVGSPATHTAPELTAAATEVKAKWTQVFK